MTEGDEQLLDFEDDWSGRTRGKDAAILAELGMSPTSYHQRLNALLDDPDALTHRPQLVMRLRRLRQRHRHVRRSA